ncbi:hypothetical protein ACFQD1_30835, partial [Nonomuraea thailandensis]
ISRRHACEQFKLVHHSRGRNRPLPTRERMIPKPGTTKRRRLGISTVRDRVVQASLKLVLEPIFEADFSRVPTGFARTAGPMMR